MSLKKLCYGMFIGAAVFYAQAVWADAIDTVLETINTYEAVNTGTLSSADRSSLNSIFNDLSSSEIEVIFASISKDQANSLIDGLGASRRREMVQKATPETLGRIMGQMDNAQTAEFLSSLNSTALNSVFSTMETNDVYATLGKLSDDAILNIVNKVDESSATAIANATTGSLQDKVVDLINQNFRKYTGSENDDNYSSSGGGSSNDILKQLMDAAKDGLTDSLKDMMLGQGDFSSKLKEMFGFDDKMNYKNAMNWRDDFKQEMKIGGPCPHKCLYIYTCPGLKKGTIAPLPACEVIVNHTEPTTHNEVAGSDGNSLLSNAVSGLRGIGKSGGLGNMVQQHFRSLGITPQARFDSSGSEEQVKKSLTCHLGNTWDKWPNMTRDFQANVFGDAGVPDKLKVSPQNVLVANLIPSVFTWFPAAGNVGKETDLRQIYDSVFDKAQSIGGSGGFQTCAVKEGMSFLSDKAASGAGQDKFALINSAVNCLGNYGSLFPLTTFQPNTGNEFQTKLLSAGRALMASLSSGKRSPIMTQMGTSMLGGLNLTPFNMDYPFKQPFRNETGVPFDAVGSAFASKAKDALGGLNFLQGQGSFESIAGLALKSDNMVTTEWKQTSCCNQVCCDPWPPNKCWRALDKWKLKRPPKNWQ